MTQFFLEEPDLLPLEPALVVPEILESVALNEASIAGIQRLRDRGFQLALDDFVDTAAFDTILPRIDIVKIDVLSWRKSNGQPRLADCANTTAGFLPKRSKRGRRSRHCEH